MSASPILVVGAGTTGLMMACELARHGVSVRIIDKLESILPSTRATGMHSRSLEVFQDLGLADELISAGQVTVGINQFMNGKRILHTRHSEIDSPYPFIVNLEQWKTEGILERRLNDLGVRVERKTELLGIGERIDGVRATLRGADGTEQTFDTPWLIGCDGSHSRVRHENRQHFPGEADPKPYLIGHVSLDGIHAYDEVYVFLSDRGAMWWFPLPDRTTLVVADLPDHVEREGEKPTLNDLQAVLDERSPGPVRAGNSRWLSWFHIHYRLSRHYRHGRTLLAGDAAHIHSLIGGQGMNTGIQDAYNLAWKLALVARGLAPESLLDSYERERRSVAEDVVAFTKRMTEKATGFAELSEPQREQLARHLVLPEAERLRFDHHMEGLDLDYRRSPVCSEHLGRHEKGAGFGPGPHAGAQALDAAALSVQGQSLTLFELISGVRHTLLLFAGREEAAAPDPALMDLARQVIVAYGQRIEVCFVSSQEDPGDTPTSGVTWVRDADYSLHGRYGVELPQLYLIRPDGYVGFRCHPPSLSALRDHLARVFTARPTQPQ